MQFTQLWKTRSEFASHSVLRKHGRRKFLQQYTWERTMSTYGRWRISEWKEDITCDHNYVCNYMFDTISAICILNLAVWCEACPIVQKFRSSKVQKFKSSKVVVHTADWPDPGSWIWSWNKRGTDRRTKRQQYYFSNYKTNCQNPTSIFHLSQSIPSVKYYNELKLPR